VTICALGIEAPVFRVDLSQLAQRSPSARALRENKFGSGRAGGGHKPEQYFLCGPFEHCGIGQVARFDDEAQTTF
jgi:hypothetical protein